MVSLCRWFLLALWLVAASRLPALNFGPFSPFGEKARNLSLNPIFLVLIKKECTVRIVLWGELQIWHPGAQNWKHFGAIFPGRICRIFTKISGYVSFINTKLWCKYVIILWCNLHHLNAKNGDQQENPCNHDKHNTAWPNTTGYSAFCNEKLPF